MLVDPTPLPLRGKMAWERFRDGVYAAPIEILKHRAQALRWTAPDDDQGQRTGIRLGLDAADSGGDLADGLILRGLMLGELVAFAYLPAAGACYRLKPECWQELPTRVAIDAIRVGVARMPVACLHPQSLEGDLQNRPLFIAVDAGRALLKLRPPSLAQLNKIAKAIIDDHRANTSAKMRKPDFVTRMIQIHPGCSKQLAAYAWAKHAPVAWKRPGRPRRP
jgi:hypothetical protein